MTNRFRSNYTEKGFLMNYNRMSGTTSDKSNVLQFLIAIGLWLSGSGNLVRAHILHEETIFACRIKLDLTGKLQFSEMLLINS